MSTGWIGFILFGILCCECVFYDLVENVIINNLKNRFECEFKDGNDSEYGELLDGLYHPTPEPTDTPPSTTIDSINSEARLPENLDLKYTFGVDCNGIEFVCNINSENILFENENENEIIVINCYMDHIVQDHIQHNKHPQQQLILVILVLNYVKMVI